MESPEINLSTQVQLTYDKEGKNVQTKTVSLIIGTGKIEQLYVKG